MAQADQKLQEFNKNPQNLLKLKYFVQKSENSYVEYLATSAIKNLLADYWLKIPACEKKGFKDYLVNYF